MKKARKIIMASLLGIAAMSILTINANATTDLSEDTQNQMVEGVNKDMQIRTRSYIKEAEGEARQEALKSPYHVSIRFFSEWGHVGSAVIVTADGQSLSLSLNQKNEYEKENINKLQQLQKDDLLKGFSDLTFYAYMEAATQENLQKSHDKLVVSKRDLSEQLLKLSQEYSKEIDFKSKELKSLQFQILDTKKQRAAESVEKQKRIEELERTNVKLAGEIAKYKIREAAWPAATKDIAKEIAEVTITNQNLRKKNEALSLENFKLKSYIQELTSDQQ